MAGRNLSPDEAALLPRVGAAEVDPVQAAHQAQALIDRLLDAGLITVGEADLLRYFLA